MCPPTSRVAIIAAVKGVNEPSISGTISTTSAPITLQFLDSKIVSNADSRCHQDSPPGTGVPVEGTR